MSPSERQGGAAKRFCENRKQRETRAPVFTQAERERERVYFYLFSCDWRALQVCAFSSAAGAAHDWV